MWPVASTPSAPRKTRSKVIRSSAASVSGPTKPWLAPAGCRRGTRRAPGRSSASCCTTAIEAGRDRQPVKPWRSSRARAPTVEPASSRIVSPWTICRRAHRAMAGLATRASPVRWRKDGSAPLRSERHRAAVGAGDLARGRELREVAPDGRGRHVEPGGRGLDARQAARVGEVDDVATPLARAGGMVRRLGRVLPVLPWCSRALTCARAPGQAGAPAAVAAARPRPAPRPRRPRRGGRGPSRRPAAAPRSCYRGRRCPCRRCRTRCRGRPRCGSPAGRR